MKWKADLGNLTPNQIKAAELVAQSLETLWNTGVPFLVGVLAVLKDPYFIFLLILPAAFSLQIEIEKEHGGLYKWKL